MRLIHPAPAPQLCASASRAPDTDAAARAGAGRADSMRRPAPSVRVVEMQSVLGSVAGSWSEMLEKLHDPALAVGEPGGGERWNELMRVLYQVPGRLEHATHTAGREFGRAHCIRAMSDAHMRRRTLASLDADIA
eukprot:1112529-Rhodomonas_salina.3